MDQQLIDLAAEITYRHRSRLALQSAAAALTGHIQQDLAAAPFTACLGAYDTAVSTGIGTLIEELRAEVARICIPGLMSQLLPDIFATGGLAGTT